MSDNSRRGSFFKNLRWSESSNISPRIVSAKVDFQSVYIPEGFDNNSTSSPRVSNLTEISRPSFNERPSLTSRTLNRTSSSGKDKNPLMKNQKRPKFEMRLQELQSAVRNVSVDVRTHESKKIETVDENYVKESEEGLDEIRPTEFLRQRASTQGSFTNLDELGNIYFAQENYPKAEMAYLQSASISKSSYGPESSEYTGSLRNLAITYRAQGKINESIHAYEEVVRLQRLLYGDKSADTLESISNLASLYRFQSQYSKAEPLMEECLAAAVQTYGDHHVNVIACKNNLANLYADCKKFNDAEEFYLSCILLCQEHSGHPSALQYMNNLALLYADQGRTQEAKALFEECLEIGTKEFGPDHPVVQGMKSNLKSLSQCIIS